LRLAELGSRGWPPLAELPQSPNWHPLQKVHLQTHQLRTRSSQTIFNRSRTPFLAAHLRLRWIGQSLIPSHLQRARFRQ
jgi:hypothetical protein